MIYKYYFDSEPNLQELRIFLSHATLILINDITWNEETKQVEIESALEVDKLQLDIVIEIYKRGV